MTVELKKLRNALAALPMALVLLGCGWEGRKVRSEFIAGCKSQGASESRCECTFDKIEAHYGIDALIEMKQSGRIARDFPVIAGTAAVACAT